MFFNFFVSICKIVDSENSMDIYKSLKISIGTVLKNPEMLKFVPDHLKTKEMYKHAVKNLPFVIRYDLDQYKTQQMCDKTILENGGTFFLTTININKRVRQLLTITLMR